MGAEQVVGSFSDDAAIATLAKQSTVLTVEIEHVNAEALAAAQSSSGVPVHPSPATIALIQDKFRQKEKMRDVGVALGDFKSVESVEQLLEVAKVRETG